MCRLGSRRNIPVVKKGLGMLMTGLSVSGRRRAWLLVPVREDLGGVVVVTVRCRREVPGVGVGAVIWVGLGFLFLWCLLLIMPCW